MMAAMVRLLGLVWGAFVVWMVIDAVRRDADSKWFWIIVLVPGGALIYFFSVKLREPGMRMMSRRLLEQLKSPPSVDELERRFERTPSIENRVLLGQALFDAGRLPEAQTHFEEVLEARPDEKEALYGLGVCRLEQDDPAGAMEPLSKLIALHRSYRDYAAWIELAEAHFKGGEREMCHELLADLVKTAPRLAHHVLRAQYLFQDGRKREAEELLRAALDDERDQPKHIRRQNRPWMRRARQLLDEVA